MSSIGGLFYPATAASNIGRSLTVARGANPRGSVATPFDQHLELALQAGAGGAGNTAGTGAQKSALGPARFAFDDIGGTASIEALRDEHRIALAEFDDRLRRLLREQGIDLGDGLVLETGPDGTVGVAGDHPQKVAIERLLASETELRNQFSQLESRASLIRAADQAAELARLQSESPADAAAQVRQLLGGSSVPRFSLTVGREQTLVQFN